ncbi:unannotated protein [freshwater metagenome]|uniref:Unannotated protein n=1 Tax=freshwater metagenome TaxID=449393 RepID=A0A6J6GP93_9ZZZZ
MTPTVVSKPVPASAIAKSDKTMDPPPSKNAPITAVAIRIAEYTADSNPTEIPARRTVAAPVCEADETSFTGRLPTSVKKPVKIWIAAARTIPIITAPSANTRGLIFIDSSRTSLLTCTSASNFAGKYVNVARAVRPAEMIADIKNERFIAVIADLSVLRRRVAKIPITAVMIPIAGTING